MLHIETVQPNALSILRRLMAMESLNSFSLVGGTALSLKFGHRTSIDLDLFSNIDFAHSPIVNSLEKEFGNHLMVDNQTTRWGIFCYIENVKTDIVYYPHPIIKEPRHIEGIRLYSTEDIIAMKINAILGRGKQKDFFDLDELLNHFPLEKMIDFHRKKYPSQNLLITIPQAITYFGDAEESEAPKTLKGQTWESVKKHIQQKVSEFLA